MPRYNHLVASIIGLSIVSSAYATDSFQWNAHTHEIRVADLKGDSDSLLDLILQPRHTEDTFGLMALDPIKLQGEFRSQYHGAWLGVSDWSAESHYLLVGQSPERDTLVLQALHPDQSSYLIAPDEHGELSTIHQTLLPDHLGLSWYFEEAQWILGDFRGLGMSDLLLQSPNNPPQWVLADKEGRFTEINQGWTNQQQLPEFKEQRAIEGYFAHSTRHDLLLQSQNLLLAELTADQDDDIPSVDTNTLIELQINSQSEQPGLFHEWSRYYLNIDWHQDAHTIVSGKFQQDGQFTDLFLQSTNPEAPSFLIHHIGDSQFPQKITQVLTSADLKLEAPISDYLMLSDDINRDGKDELIFIPTGDVGVPAYYTSDISGLFTAAGRHELKLSGFDLNAHKTSLPKGASSSTPDQIFASNSIEDPAIQEKRRKRMRNTVPGSTTTQFNVDNRGAATYNIPFVMPEGTAGMQPEIALTYSSQSGNGVVGMGWGIAGASVIHRCPATLAQDGYIHGIDFTELDRLCIDGQRLVAINAQKYGSNGTEYRTQIESFRKIISYGTKGAGPDYFVVWTKDGERLEFGNSSDSKIIATGRADVSVWAMNKREDRTGNYYTAHYHTDGQYGQYYLDRINYTGNDTAGVVPYASLRFNYGSGYSRLRDDLVDSYVAGSQMRMRFRLDNIKAYYQDQVVREYDIIYKMSDRTKRSQVIEIWECASDGLCFNPLNFDWLEELRGWYRSDPQPGFPSNLGLTIYDTQSTRAVDRAVLVDLTGNGYTDIILSAEDKNNNAQTINTVYLNDGGTWRVSQEYRLPRSANVFSSKDFWSYSQAQFVDINGDGLPDLVYSYQIDSGTPVTETYLNTGSGWVLSPNYKLPEVLTRYSSSKNRSYSRGELIDVNGDGLPDLVIAAKDQNGNTVLNTYLNTGSGWNTTPVYGYRLPQPMMQYSTEDYSSYRRGMFIDINGDGLPDYVVDVYKDGAREERKVWLNQATLCSGEKATDCWKESSSLYFLPADLKGLFTYTTKRTDVKFAGFQRGTFIDLNGNGMLDLMVAISEKDPSSIPTRQAWINTGSTWDVNAGAIHIPPTSLWVFDPQTLAHYPLGELVDVREKGRLDIVISYNGSNHADSHVTYLKMPNGWQKDVNNYYALNETLVTVDKETYGYYYRAHQMELLGNGLGSFFYSLKPVSGTGMEVMYLNDGQIPDRIKHIENGWASEISINYLPITQKSVYTKGNKAQFPVMDFQSPLYVVSVTDTSNGIGGMNRTSYRYEGAQYHQQGWGYLGFSGVIRKDEGLGLEMRRYYSQEFLNHQQGLEILTETYNYERDVVVNRTETTWKTQPFIYDNGTRFYNHPSEVIETSFDLTGALLNTTTSIYEYDDYGNPAIVSSLTQDSYSDIETITLSDYENNSTDWHIGQMTYAEAQHNASQKASQSRDSAYTYYEDSGLIHQEIIAPADANLAMVTTYVYNAFGEPIETTQTGNDISPRTDTTVYDEFGRYPRSTRNPMGHTETYEYHPYYGKITEQTGPNGLTTRWYYDSFGREVLQVLPDGTEINNEYLSCVSNCPVDAVFQVKQQQTGSPEVITYFDELGREVGIRTQGFDGRAIWKLTEYDAHDRPWRVSEPFYDNDARYYTETYYDVLGRVTQQIYPDGSVSTTEYQGYTSIITNSLGQIHKETINAHGYLIASEDELGSVSQYQYDVLGNLTHIIDPAGNLTLFAYDNRGRKTASHDPNRGNWTFKYNVLDELIEQTDGLGKVTQYLYDNLGRIITQIAPEGTSRWIYDTGFKAIGKLVSSTGPDGHGQNYTYDLLGRPETVIARIGTYQYTTRTTYDEYSRLETFNYPTGFSIQYDYNAIGYLTHIRNSLDVNKVYWEAQAMDSRSNVSQSLLGNGITELRVHRADTGYIDRIYNGKGSSQAIIDQSYQWDTVGNLRVRQDHAYSQSDSFDYDNLNRLVLANVNGKSINYEYNHLGNLTYKSDFGSYTGYGQNAGPNAVTSVQPVDPGAPDIKYEYDANGNMISDGTRTLYYNSDNMPYLIEKGSSSVAFTYGPDQDRLIREDKSNVETILTHYVNGVYERVFDPGNGVAKHKHYIQGLAIYEESENLKLESSSDKASKIHPPSVQTTSILYYLHFDHLGSLTAITDELGALIERYQYDPFGEQTRIASKDPINKIISTITNRGFTGHEQIDSMDLIHMGGRIYDPLLGRFLSADPVIQTPSYSQNLNPYTYVLNNPFSYTDPSGYFFKSIFKAISKAFKSVVKAVTNAVKAVAEFVADVVTTAYKAVEQALMESALLQNLGYLILNVTGNQWAIPLYAGYLTAIQGGSFGDIVLATATSAIGGYASAGISAGLEVIGNNNFILEALAQGTLRGAAASAQGGSFQDAFVGSVIAGVFSNMGADTIYQRVISATVIGGASAVATGRSFADGAKTGAFMSLFSEAARYYEKSVGRDANPLPGENRPDHNKYDPDEMGRQKSEDASLNVIGLNEETGFFRQGGAFSKTLNVIPTMNATAGLHDYWFNKPGGLEFTPINNMGTMVPAAVISISAVIGSPISTLDATSKYYAYGMPLY